MRFLMKIGALLCVCFAVFFSFLLTPAPDNDSAVQALRFENTFILPASLQTIGEEAFEGTAASAVILPENQLTVFQRAFSNMIHLEAINIPETGTLIGNTVFSGSQHVVIYGAEGGRAEQYARNNHLEFCPVQEWMQGRNARVFSIRRLTALYQAFQILILAYILKFRITGRKNCETRSLQRKRRIEMHTLDEYFP